MKATPMMLTMWTVLVAGAVAGQELTVSTPGFPQKPSDTAHGADLNITVWVYNYAEIRTEALAEAKSEAGRIFRLAGVKLAWVDCPRSEEEVPKYPACRGVLGPTSVVLWILPRSQASLANGHMMIFGRAMLPKDSGFGF